MLEWLFGKSKMQKIWESIKENRRQREIQRNKLMQLSNYELAKMDDKTMIEAIASCGDINSSVAHEKICQVYKVRSNILAEQFSFLQE